MDLINKFKYILSSFPALRHLVSPRDPSSGAQCGTHGGHSTVQVRSTFQHSLHQSVNVRSSHFGSECEMMRISADFTRTTWDSKTMSLVAEQ